MDENDQWLLRVDGFWGIRRIVANKVELEPALQSQDMV